MFIGRGVRCSPTRLFQLSILLALYLRKNKRWDVVGFISFNTIAVSRVLQLQSITFRFTLFTREGFGWTCRQGATLQEISVLLLYRSFLYLGFCTLHKWLLMELCTKPIKRRNPAVTGKFDAGLLLYCCLERRAKFEMSAFAYRSIASAKIWIIFHTCKFAKSAKSSTCNTIQHFTSLYLTIAKMRFNLY